MKLYQFRNILAEGKATPIYRDVKGAPFKIGQRVKCVKSLDDEDEDKEFIGKTGEVEYLEYSCGCGQIYPHLPMIGVKFDDGERWEFWPLELKKIKD